jgi:hypothetical protein
MDNKDILTSHRYVTPIAAFQLFNKFKFLIRICLRFTAYDLRHPTPNNMQTSSDRQLTFLVSIFTASYEPGIDTNNARNLAIDHFNLYDSIYIRVQVIGPACKVAAKLERRDWKQRETYRFCSSKSLLNVCHNHYRYPRLSI